MFRRKKYLGIITGDVVTADEGSSAFDIAVLMKKNNIGVVVIVKDEGVLGTVSERDLARNVLAKGSHPKDVSAKECMNEKVVSVQIKEGLNNIYKTLCEMKFRHLVVMDGNKLVGITSRRDLLDVVVKKTGEVPPI